jgi:hypothetical protein
MVLLAAASQPSHRLIPLAHGTGKYHTSFPLAFSLTPWSCLLLPLNHPMGFFLQHMALENITSPSHGHFPPPHGPAWHPITPVPWVCYYCPRDTINPADLFHGLLSCIHGPACCCLTTVPWVYSSSTQHRLHITTLSHGCAFSPHGPQDSPVYLSPWYFIEPHGILNFPWPMVLHGVQLHLSHGYVAMIQGILQILPLYPMCTHPPPMVLFGAPLHLSHGNMPVAHGTSQIFQHFPWATFQGPWPCLVLHCTHPIWVLEWSIGHEKCHLGHDLILPFTQ